MKKSELRLMIREIVREEVGMTIKNVINEMRGGDNIKPTKPVKEKKYTKNPVLNEILNETAGDEEWKTLGGGTYDSNRMGEIIGSEYNNSPGISETTSGFGGGRPNEVLKNVFEKDYSEVMKAIDNKKAGK